MTRGAGWQTGDALSVKTPEPGANGPGWLATALAAVWTFLGSVVPTFSTLDWAMLQSCYHMR